MLSVSQFSIDDVTVTEGDDTGAFVDVLLPDPDTAGSLEGPGEFVIGPDDNMYVAGINEVLRYDMTTGDLIDVFVPSGAIGGPAFADSVGPFGLAFSPLDGNLYVGSWDGNEVLRYQGPTGPSPGAFVDAFIPDGRIDKAANLLFDSAGTLYVSSIDSDEVLHYDANGDFIEVAVAASDGLDDPQGFAFDGNGGLLVASNATSQILRYDIATETTSVFVSAGSGGLVGPQGLEFGVDGNLYVASTGTDQVLRYDGSTGAFDEVFVPAKSGGLMWTGDLLFAPDGEMYVGSYAVKAILKFDGSTGAFLDYFALSPKLTTPRGVEFGPDGSLYVSNWYGRTVKRYDGQSGTFIEHFVTPESGGTSGLAELHFGPDGNLYVSNAVSIVRFNGSTGAFIDTFIPAGEGGLDHPREFIFHTDGMLYVSSMGSESVLRFDSGSGQFVDVFVAPQAGGLDAPTGIAFGPDGHLYVLDRGTGDVFRYNGTSGAFLDVFASGDGQVVKEYVDSLVFGPDGHLYVMSSGEHRVLRYDGATGEYLGNFVSPGLGGVVEPYALAFDSNGSLYVADQGTTPGGHVMRYAPASHAALRVTLSDPSATFVTVDYATADGTARVVDNDYQAAGGTLTFAPGETSKTIIVPTIDDTVGEFPETFTVELSNPTGGATLSGSPGVATILDQGDPFFDFGDAPDPTYPTLLASDGARHIAVDPTLGTLRDWESDGQPNATATGDDLAGGSSDEDGITTAPLLAPGLMGTPVTITASAASFLNAWIDYNRNGIWELSEQVAVDLSLDTGANPLNLDVPLWAVPGPTYARLRLTSYNTGGSLGPAGPATDGEVEDYAWTIENDLYFQGTGSDDTIVAQAGVIGVSQHQVDINGTVTAYEPAVFDTIYVDALGGNDTITIQGTSGNETAALSGSNVSVTKSSAYGIYAQSVETINVDAGTGTNDQVQIDGSTGSNRLYSYAGYARISDSPNTYSYRVDGFDGVSVNSPAGGRNYAFLYDSPQDDVLDANPDRVILNRAVGTADATTTTIAGFARVYSYGTGGGMDDAVLAGSASTRNRFYGYADYSILTESRRSFYFYARGFDDVTAASPGSQTTYAYLYDSSGLDTLTASPTSATMNRADPWSTTTATGFKRLYAYSTRGGEDTAELTGSSVGGNYYRGYPTYSTLTDGARSFYHYARGFRSVEVTGSQTDTSSDRAYLYDSSGADTLVGSGHSAILKDTLGISYQIEALYFDLVYARSSDGEINDTDAVDETVIYNLIRSGTW